MYDLFVLIMLCLKIWCPWVRCVIGELQYELMLGIFWENMEELSSFGTEDPPLFPYGKTPRPAPPQSKVLGVEKSKVPVWKYEFNIHALYGVSEKLPPPNYAFGLGPELGKVETPALSTFSSS